MNDSENTIRHIPQSLSTAGLGTWLSIEIAPKDRRILGCTWHPNLPHLYAPKMIVWAAYHPNSKGKECWRDAEICGNKMERVTHWMPLPEAPNV